ncbi:MAG: glucose-6-phosphate isomerase [Geobacteraceae bacterium]|nr:glucose-6-phosphate isomerase [Geobacteraceae bacterium]
MPMPDWKRYCEYLCHAGEIGVSLDISRMNFDRDFFARMEPAMQKAYADMQKLEAGAIANPDEGRMVGHYWLRSPDLAPKSDISAEIEFTIRAVKEFAADIHEGVIASVEGRHFSRLLIIGIGGSALGPQFVADALAGSNDRMRPYFLDNTDPDGMERVFAEIGAALGETLAIVISKSGGTKETRNGMLEAMAAYKRQDLDFAKHAVAITGSGSELDEIALEQQWLARFPMWDWVGGRTSVTSAVGLLPAALQGIDIDALLKGARDCDAITRVSETVKNPAALLALMWYWGTAGNGSRDMVLLPYKDRLILFSRYLQQLIMESIGKEKDLGGTVVNQGISVYGNKGATDQHAYVQQLREGVNNFFVTFIEVLKEREGEPFMVEPGVTSGDYLSGFLQGTREALSEAGRESMTITVDRIDARTIGVLIALYERAVGFYASLVGINAYHQPGVEAGKKAAGQILSLQKSVLSLFAASPGRAFTAKDVAAALGKPDKAEQLFRILRHLSANRGHGIKTDIRVPIWESLFRADP